MELQILAILLLCASSLADLSAEYNNTSNLDGDNYKLYWTHNATSNMMYIALEVKATGWIALAFTKEKSDNMKNYDACLGYVSGATKVLKDYLTDGHKAPIEDTTNNCMLDDAMETGGTTTLKYHRKVDTGDSKDVVIGKGDIILVWAYKNTDKTLSRHDKRGFQTLTIIGSGSPGSGSPVTASPVTASPVTASPVTASPVTGTSVTGNPVTGNPTTGSPGSGAEAAKLKSFFWKITAASLSVVVAFFFQVK